MPDLFIDGDIEDDEEKEWNESMDHQVEVDAIDLDIDFVCSEITRDNIFIKSGTTVGSDVLRAAIAGVTAHGANICINSLDHLMLKELRNVVAE